MFISGVLVLTVLLLSLTHTMALRVLGKARQFGVWWILFGLPFITALLGWAGLWHHRKSEADLPIRTVALFATTGAVLLAIGEVTYVQFVRDLSWQEGGGVCGVMLLFSLFGFISGVFTVRSPQWFSVLALATSAWMLVLSFSLGMAI